MKLISEKDPIETFKEASSILYKAVAHTLGPAGSNTAVVYGKDIQANPKFQIINDGKTIIDNLTSTEAEIACALQTIRESVLSTNSVAGDGTTSTIILINSLLNCLSDYLESNPSVTKFEICRQLDLMKRGIYKILPSCTHKLGEYITLEQIAETSLGSNEWVNLFKQAFDFVGEYGEVLLEKSNSNLPELEEIDGISFNQIGFIPDLYLDNTGTINKSLEDETEGISVILIKGEIKAFNTLSSLLLVSKSRPIIMFYDKMSVDVLRLLTQNLLKDPEYKLFTFSLEGYGSEVMRYYSLLSEITKAKILDASKSIDYNDHKIYGVVDGFLVNKDALILKPVAEDIENITKYIKDNKYHLSTKTAIIRAGANNSIALEEQYRRFEDAIHSCSNAIKYGVCLGGGLTYIHIANELFDNDYIDNSIQKPVLKALSAIYISLLKNCDLACKTSIYELDTIDSKIFLPKLDEETGKYSLTEHYVYDSYKVTEQVLINAIDMVHSIFSTKILICDPQR